MLYKKRLCLFLMFGFLFNIMASGIKVKAAERSLIDKENSSIKIDKRVYEIPPMDEEKIYELLIGQGKITNQTTIEEINKLIKEYIKQQNISIDTKFNEEENKLRERMLKNAQDYDIEENESVCEDIKDTDKSFIRENLSDKGLKVSKPLVILMDFKNYKYSQIKDKERFYKLKYDDYSRQHYEDILFNDDTYMGSNGKRLVTMKGFYKHQSGGSYIINGDVYGWYTSEYDAQYYGKDLLQGKTIIEKDINVQELVKEALKKLCEENVDLSQYDLEDRYDYNDNGNYNEPDGIIDHLIIVHAGIGQAVGGGSLGNDAVWAHRGKLKEDYEVTYVKEGKEYKIKAASYTMQSQDSSVGVYCHEYGHDLGLPDEYDTKYSGEGSPVSYWSVMGKGCYAGEISETEPVGFSPWCKRLLQANYGGNWLRGKEIFLDEIPQEGKEFILDTASSKGVNNDTIIINLPDKKRKINTPAGGKNEYYSGKGNNYSSSMTANIDLTGKKEALLKFRAWYKIEKGWDFASVQVRELGTKKWNAVQGNITTENYNKDNAIKVRYGITGDSKGWKNGEFNLDEYAGKNIEIMFKYETDASNLSEVLGFYIDNIIVESGKEILFKDDAEGKSQFKLKGFKKNDGVINSKNYYMLEWRNYEGVDSGLKNTRRGIAFEPGLVIWYADDYYDNNWTGEHPGEGFIGVVDADQSPVLYKYLYTGKVKGIAQSDYQMHDAAFSLKPESEIKINDKWRNIRIEDENIFMYPIFDDEKDYTNNSLPCVGLKLPQHGLKISIVGQSPDESFVKIHITKCLERCKEASVE